MNELPKNKKNTEHSSVHEDLKRAFEALNNYKNASKKNQSQDSSSGTSEKEENKG